MQGIVKGILIEHNGVQYVLTSDGRYPDLLRADGNGGWESIKKRGPTGEAGPMARSILGTPGTEHTQTVLRELGVESMQELIALLFQGAWGG